MPTYQRKRRRPVAVCQDACNSWEAVVWEVRLISAWTFLPPILHPSLHPSVPPSQAVPARWSWRDAPGAEIWWQLWPSALSAPWKYFWIQVGGGGIVPLEISRLKVEPVSADLEEGKQNPSKSKSPQKWSLRQPLARTDLNTAQTNVISDYSTNLLSTPCGKKPSFKAFNL